MRVYGEGEKKIEPTAQLSLARADHSDEDLLTHAHPINTTTEGNTHTHRDHAHTPAESFTTVVHTPELYPIWLMPLTQKVDASTLGTTGQGGHSSPTPTHRDTQRTAHTDTQNISNTHSACIPAESFMTVGPPLSPEHTPELYPIWLMPLTQKVEASTLGTTGQGRVLMYPVAVPIPAQGSFGLQKGPLQYPNPSELGPRAV